MIATLILQGKNCDLSGTDLMIRKTDFFTWQIAVFYPNNKKCAILFGKYRSP